MHVSVTLHLSMPFCSCNVCMARILMSLPQKCVAPDPHDCIDKSPVLFRNSRGISKKSMQRWWLCYKPMPLSRLGSGSYAPTKYAVSYLSISLHISLKMSRQGEPAPSWEILSWAQMIHILAVWPLAKKIFGHAHARSNCPGCNNQLNCLQFWPKAFWETADVAAGKKHQICRLAMEGELMWYLHKELQVWEPISWLYLAVELLKA